jgi:hypothetical protein
MYMADQIIMRSVESLIPYARNVADQDRVGDVRPTLSRSEVRRLSFRSSIWASGSLRASNLWRTGFGELELGELLAEQTGGRPDPAVLDVIMATLITKCRLARMFWVRTEPCRYAARKNGTGHWGGDRRKSANHRAGETARSHRHRPRPWPRRSPGAPRPRSDRRDRRNTGYRNRPSDALSDQE